MKKVRIWSKGWVIALLSIAAPSAMARSTASAVPDEQAVPIRRPVLGTPEQIAIEQLLTRLLGDPDIAAARRAMAAELAATPTGQTTDGAAMLDRAVWQWTSSDIVGEITSHRAEPAFFWWEDAPHMLAGQTVWGTGIGSDLPDNIYRRVTLDGSGQYEITGRIDLANRPAILIFEVMRGKIGPTPLNDTIKKNADMGNFVSSITDRKMTIAPDGSFRIMLGGPGLSSNYLATAPGDLTVMVRENLTDWNQRPSELHIRRVGGAAPKPPSYDELKKRVLAGLAPYIRFWSNWHVVNMGGFAPNTYKKPVARAGGFGYAGKLRFQLGADQAILLTLSSGNARYFSVHVSDPWEITADSRHYQISLNPTQARPNSDGTYTYVIGPKDPGVANWVDTAGLHDGYAILRWQDAPPGFSTDDAVRDFRVVKLSDLADMPGMIHVSALQRQLEQAANFAAYARRVTE